MRDFELVIPAYNESPSLKTLIERAVQSAHAANYTCETFQLILVNNGSTDDSAQELERLSASELGPWFRVVHVSPNRGYGHGMWQGLQNSESKYVGWSHADMQCDPQDAFHALALLLDAGASSTFVKGTRSGRNWKDKFVTRVFEILARIILGVQVNEINAQPKVMRADLLKHFSQPPLGFPFDLYALYQAQKQGLQTRTVDVEFPPRIHGASKWASNFLSRYKTILGFITYMWELKNKEGRL